MFIVFVLFFQFNCTDSVQSIGKNAQEELERIVKEDNKTGGVSSSGQNDYSSSTSNPYGTSSNTPVPQGNGTNWVNGTSGGAQGTPSLPQGTSTFGGVTGSSPREREE
jgi:hypothetical protein